MRHPLLLGAAVAVACATATAPPAVAVLPSNGEIAFSRIATGGDTTIYTVSPSGGAVPQRLVAGGFPDWDPSGQYLAFVRGGSIWTVSASGTGATRVVRNASYPAFSNAGSQLAYVKNDSLWVSKVDGTAAKRVFAHAKNWAVSTPDWGPGDDQVAFNYVRTDTEPPDLPVVQIRTYAFPGQGLRSRILNQPRSNPGPWVNGGVSLSWMPRGDQIKVTMTGGPAGGPAIGVGTMSSSGSSIGTPGITGAAYAQWAPNAQALCLAGPSGLQTVAFPGTTLKTIVAPGSATIGACSWRPRP
ncbi:MAG: WD40-like beta Propeller containing protein [Solirubrobacterales bacterium]|nr:WD40-like beta Propeller containing protein [Solirubrobacterales bacterium]